MRHTGTGELYEKKRPVTAGRGVFLLRGKDIHDFWRNTLVIINLRRIFLVRW